MSLIDTLLIAGDGEAADAAAGLCSAAGIRATAVAGVSDPYEPIGTFAGGLLASTEGHQSEWLLYLRAGEFLTRGVIEELAREFSREVPRAFAFRLRRQLFEGPLPLILEDPLARDGEIRLLYRRRARYRKDGSLVNSGTVLRLAEALHVDVHRSGLVSTRGERASLSAMPLLLRRPSLLFHPPSASFVARHPEVVRRWLTARRS